VAISAVQKAIASKRITPNPDGTIDPERANEEWERNTFAGKTLHQPTQQAAKPRTAPPPPRGVSGMPRPPEVSSDPITAYLRARAVTETYKARTAQLEYEERAGKLIPATQAGEYASSFSNIARDQVSAWADRLTQVLMPFFAPGTDDAVIHRLLMRERQWARHLHRRHLAVRPGHASDSVPVAGLGGQVSPERRIGWRSRIDGDAAHRRVRGQQEGDHVLDADCRRGEPDLHRRRDPKPSGVRPSPVHLADPILNEGNDLAFDIKAVASPNPGSDLTVIIRT
jgi:hypothetical protein